MLSDRHTLHHNGKVQELGPGSREALLLQWMPKSTPGSFQAASQPAGNISMVTVSPADQLHLQ